MFKSTSSTQSMPNGFLFTQYAHDTGYTIMMKNICSARYMQLRTLHEKSNKSSKVYKKKKNLKKRTTLMDITSMF